MICVGRCPWPTVRLALIPLAFVSTSKTLLLITIAAQIVLTEFETIA